MIEKKSHGAILKEILEKRNMKAIQVARLADLPPTTIYAMLKRNNRNTEPETLAKLSKALNIPIAYWNDYSDEDRVLRLHNLSSMQEDKISSTVFYEALSVKNLSVEYVCHILQAFGYSYTPEMIKECIDEQVTIPHPVAVIIQDAILSTPLLNYKDYEFIQDFNSLSKQSRSLIEEIMIVLHKSEFYDDKQLDNFIKETKGKSDEDK